MPPPVETEAPCFRNDRAAHSCAAGPGPQQSSPSSHVTSPGPGCPTPKPASHATASRWVVCPRSRPPPALVAGGGSVLPVDDGRASLPRELTRQVSTGVGRTRITDRHREPPGERPTHLRHSLCRGRRLTDSAAGQRVAWCDRHNHSGITTSRELAAEKKHRYSSEPAAQEYQARLRAVRQEKPGFLPQ
jgi:hypothetical protein